MRSQTRYTRNQAAEHGGILTTYGLQDLTPDRHLVENMAIKLSDARKELEAYKAKNIFALAWERWFK